MLSLVGQKNKSLAERLMFKLQFPQILTKSKFSF
uniref:Uncharacterized protein n=1 Tax=Rhizophora mucronata TaxID=61149 RepID=A0A2P2LNN8_RHIMU